MAHLPRRKTEAWREALKLLNRCPVCGALYQAEDAQVYAREAHVSLVHLSCRQCHGFFMAMVMLLGAGVSSVGMVTDLNFFDLERLHAATPLEIDEVIDSHGAIHDPNFVSHLVFRV